VVEPQLTTPEVCWGSADAFFFFGREVSRETAKLSSLFLDSSADALDSSADAAKLSSLFDDSSADAADLSIIEFFVSLGT